MTKDSIAEQPLNDEAFHRSIAHANKHEKLFEVINHGQLGAINKTWDLDADNNFLSNSKMKYERNQKMVRMIKAIPKEEVREQKLLNKQKIRKGLQKLGRNRKPIELDESSQSDGEQEDMFVYTKFPVWGTNTGWFHCSADYTVSDIAEELGIGISIYFKQLKCLVFMLLVCTILSIPSYVMFWYGEAQFSNGIQASKSFFASLTLGNLGQSQFACKSFSLGEITHYELIS